MLPDGVVILTKANNTCVFKNQCTDEMLRFQRQVDEPNNDASHSSMREEIEDPFEAKVFEFKDNKHSLIDLSNIFEWMEQPEKTIECTMLPKRHFQIKQKDIDFKDQLCKMILLNDLTIYANL